MFFLIGGIQEKRKLIKTFNNVVCACGKLASAELIEFFSCFHIFFIPLFKWNRRYYIISRCCGPYECSNEYADELQHKNAAVDFSRMKKREPNVFYDYNL